MKAIRNYPAMRAGPAYICAKLFSALFCLICSLTHSSQLYARYESTSAGELIFTQRFGPYYPGYSAWMAGAHTRFGESVSVHGDYIVVGAPGASARGGGPGGVRAAGRVYIFKRERGLWFEPNPSAEEWGVYSTDNMAPWNARLVQVLESPHAVPNGDFGASISFNGDWLIVGAPGEFVPSESPEIGDISRTTAVLADNLSTLLTAGVFSSTLTGLTNNLLTATQIGGAVAGRTFDINERIIDRGAAVVADLTVTALEALNVGNVRAGATWVFRRSRANGDVWLLSQRLQEGPEPFFQGDSVPVPNERFGAAVALAPDGRSLAIGVPFNRDADFLNLHASMGLYQQYASYVPTIGPLAVAASEIIMTRAEPTRKGRVVIYGYNDREGRWIREMGRSARFFSNDGWEDQFGAALAWSHDGSMLAVGAPKAAAEGRVHIFTRTTSTEIPAEGRVLEPLIGARKRLDRRLAEIFSDIGLSTMRRDAAILDANRQYENSIPQARDRTNGAWRDATRQELIPATNYGGVGSPLPGFGTALAWAPNGTLLVGNPRRGTVSAWQSPTAGAELVFTDYLNFNDLGDFSFNRTDARDWQAGFALAVSNDGRTAFIGLPEAPTGSPALAQGRMVAVPLSNRGVLSRQESFNVLSGARFGRAVAFGEDGYTLVVGAPGTERAYAFNLYVPADISLQSGSTSNMLFLEGTEGNSRLLFIHPEDAQRFPRTPQWMDPFWVEGALTFPSRNSLRTWLPAQRTNRLLSSDGSTLYTIQTGSDAFTAHLSTPTYTIMGRTTDGISPVPGVLVTMDYPHSRTTTSDANGEFNFTNVSFADTRILGIRLSKDGYTFPGLIDWGDTFSPGHVERIRASATPIVFDFVAPSATLTGRVSTGTLAAADFSVHLLNNADPDTIIASVQPNADGSYQFSHLQGGSYTIKLIDPMGFDQQLSINVPLVTTQDTVIQVPMFEVLYDVTGAILSKGVSYPFSTTVEFRRLDPPPGTTVPPMHTMGTGGYHIRLQPGRYTVELLDPAQHLNMALAQRTRTIEVAGPVTDVSFTIPTGSLDGRITTHSGTVVEPFDFSGSVVDLYIAVPTRWSTIRELLFIARAHTDSLGNYSFSDLVPGTYLAVLPGNSSRNVNPPMDWNELDPSPNRFFPARQSPLASVSYSIDDSTHQTGYFITMWNPGDPPGNLRDRNTVAASELHRVRANETLADGNVMADLYPHSFRVLLRAPDGQNFLAPAHSRISYMVPADRSTLLWTDFYRSLHGLRHATINADSATTVWMHSQAVPFIAGAHAPASGTAPADPLQQGLPVVQLEPVTIAGRITSLQSNIGVANIPVTGPWLDAVPETDVHGVFTGTIWPFVANIEPQSSLLQFEPLRRTVLPPYPGQSYNFASTHPVVSGTITINGIPAQGIRVWNSLGQSLDTDAFGRFNFDFLSAEQETFTIDPRNGMAHPTQWVVDLTQGTVRGLNFELKTGHLQIGPVLHAETGQPLSGMRIQYERIDELNPQLQGRVTLDQNGSYRLPDLPTGTYRLNVLPDNISSLFPLEQTVVVLPDQTAVASWNAPFPRFADSSGFLYLHHPGLARTGAAMPPARMHIPLDTSRAITIETWLAPEQNPRDGTLPILSWFDRDPAQAWMGNNGIHLILDRGGRPTLVMDFSQGTNSRSRTFLVTPQAIPFNGLWTHLAVVLTPGEGASINPSTHRHDLTVFINGRAVHSAKGVILPAASGIQHAFLGWKADYHRINSEIRGPHQFFGSIDDLRVWQRAFTQAELQANIVQPPPSNAPDLLASYRFDNPVQALLDESPAARHGTVLQADHLSIRPSYDSAALQGQAVTLFPQIQTMGNQRPTVEVLAVSANGQAWPTPNNSVRVQSDADYKGLLEVDIHASVGRWNLPEQTLSVDVLDYPNPTLAVLTPNPSRGSPVRLRLHLPDGLRAPNGGLSYRLGSEQHNILSMPSVAFIPAGASHADFDILTPHGSVGLEIDISANRGSSIANLTFTLGRSATDEVSGRVWIGGTTPLPNVTVRAGNLTTTTDLNGFYRFVELPFGNYPLSVELPAGFEPTNTELVISSSLIPALPININVRASGPKILPMNRLLQFSGGLQAIDLQNWTQPRLWRTPLEEPLQFSLETWVRHTSIPTTEVVLFDFADLDNPQSRLRLVWNTATRTFEFSTAPSARITGASGPPSEWHHIAVTFSSDSDAPTGRAVIYVQGLPVAVGELPRPQAAGFNAAGFAAPLPHSSGSLLIGMADSVRLWSRNLQPEELMGRLTAFVPQNRSQLLAELLFDERSGSVLLDTSGNSLHATFQQELAIQRIHANSIMPVGGNQQQFMVPVASLDFRSAEVVLVTEAIGDWVVSGFHYDANYGGYRIPPNTVVSLRSNSADKSWRPTAFLLDGSGNHFLPDSSLEFAVIVSQPSLTQFTTNPFTLRRGWSHEALISARFSDWFDQTFDVAFQRETATGWETEHTVRLFSGLDHLEFLLGTPQSFNEEREVRRYRLLSLHPAYVFSENQISIEILPSVETVPVFALRRGQRYPIQTLTVFSGISPQPRQIPTTDGWLLSDVSPNHARFFITPQQQHTGFVPSQFILQTTPETTSPEVIFRVIEPQIVSTVAVEVIDGGSVQLASLQLDRPSPLGGTDILLTSSNPALLLPALVTVPEGATSVQFAIRAESVAELIEVEWFAVLDEQELSFHTWIAPQSRTLAGWAFDVDQPFAHATVLLSGPGGISRSTTTDANGGFRFDNLIDGEYTVDLPQNALNWEQNSFTVTVGDEPTPALRFSSRHPVVTAISWPESLDPFVIAEGEVVEITLHFDQPGPAQGGGAILSSIPAGALDFVPTHLPYLAPGATTATATIRGGSALVFARATLRASTANGAFEQSITLETSPVSVSGAVFDENLLPLVDHPVHVTGTALNGTVIHEFILTGYDGGFSINLHPGNYMISPVEVAGLRFEPRSANLQPRSLAITGLDFTALPPRILQMQFLTGHELLGGSDTILRIALDRSASIDGFDVALQTQFDRIEVPAFVHVPFGESVVEIELPTLPTVFPLPETVSANFRGATAQASITLVGPNHLSGSVIYAGQPLQGASLAIQITGPQSRAFTVTSDANGFWSSGQLPRNTLVHISASFAGRHIGSRSLLTTSQPIQNLDFVLEGPPIAVPTIPFLRIGESRDITLQLAAEVLPGSGGLLVNLSSSNPVLSLPTTVLVAEGERSFTFTAQAGTVTAITAATISVSYGGRVFQLPTGVEPYALRMVVEFLNEQGRPIQGGLFRIHHPESGMVSNVTTGTNGRALAVLGLPGLYTVSAILNADGYRVFPENRTVTLNAESLGEVKVDFDGLFGWPVALNLPAFVAGNQNITGTVEMQRTNIGFSARIGYSGGDTQANVSVSDGFSGNRNLAFSLPLFLAEEYPRTVTLKATSGRFASVSADILVTSPLAIVRGSATVNNTPLAGASVTLMGNGLYQVATTAADGSFHFDNIPYADYTVSIERNGISFSPASLQVSALDLDTYLLFAGLPEGTALDLGLSAQFGNRFATIDPNLSGNLHDGLFQSGFTVSAWIYPDSLIQVSNPTVLALAMTGGDGIEFGLDSHSGRPRLSTRFQITHSVVAPSTTPVARPGQWNHIAATFMNGRVVLFFNGSQVAEFQNVPRPPATGFNQLNHSFIGRAAVTAAIPDPPVFPGALDNVRFWSRALSPAEIAAESVSPLLSGALANRLELNFTFEETRPSIHTSDVSGRGRNAVFSTAHPPIPATRLNLIESDPTTAQVRLAGFNVLGTRPVFEVDFSSLSGATAAVSGDRVIVNFDSAFFGQTSFSFRADGGQPQTVVLRRLQSRNLTAFTHPTAQASSSADLLFTLVADNAEVGDLVIDITSTEPGMIFPDPIVIPAGQTTTTFTFRSPAQWSSGGNFTLTATPRNGGASQALTLQKVDRLLSASGQVRAYASWFHPDDLFQPIPSVKVSLDLGNNRVFHTTTDNQGVFVFDQLIQPMAPFHLVVDPIGNFENPNVLFSSGAIDDVNESFTVLYPDIDWEIFGTFYDANGNLFYRIWLDGPAPRGGFPVFVGHNAPEILEMPLQQVLWINEGERGINIPITYKMPESTVDVPLAVGFNSTIPTDNLGTLLTLNAFPRKVSIHAVFQNGTPLPEGTTVTVQQDLGGSSSSLNSASRATIEGVGFGDLSFSMPELVGYSFGVEYLNSDWLQPSVRLTVFSVPQLAPVGGVLYLAGGVSGDGLKLPAWAPANRSYSLEIWYKPDSAEPVNGTFFHLEHSADTWLQMGIDAEGFVFLESSLAGVVDRLRAPPPNGGWSPDRWAHIAAFRSNAINAQSGLLINGGNMVTGFIPGIEIASYHQVSIGRKNDGSQALRGAIALPRIWNSTGAASQSLDSGPLGTATHLWGEWDFSLGVRGHFPSRVHPTRTAIWQGEAEPEVFVGSHGFAKAGQLNQLMLPGFNLDGLPFTFSLLDQDSQPGVEVSEQGRGVSPNNRIFQVVARNINGTGTPLAVSTLDIKQPATITLGGLLRTFDGNPQAVTAGTVPGGLPVQILYNGSTTTPTTVGEYPVLAFIVHPEFSAEVSGTLIIAPANQSISFEPPSTLPASATPYLLTAGSNSGLPVTFRLISGPAILQGNSLTPTGAGSIVVAAEQSGENQMTPATVTRVITVDHAPGTITIAPADRVFDGTPQSLQVSTSPANLTVRVRYNGSPIPPTNAGTYLVTAVIEDPFHVGEASAMLTIERAAQTITWQALPQSLAPGATLRLVAVSSAGLPVILERLSGPGGFIGNSWLRLSGTAGTLTLRASQPGNFNFLPASSELSLEAPAGILTAQDTFSRRFGLPLRIMPLGLLANNTLLLDGQTLEWNGVDNFSTHGGQIQVCNGVLIYHPPWPDAGDDSFRYHVRSSGGAEATGTVNISAWQPGPGAPALSLEPFQSPCAEHNLTIYVLAPPNSTVQIETSTDLQSWTIAGIVATDHNGHAHFTSPVGNLFFRAKTLP